MLDARKWCMSRELSSVTAWCNTTAMRGLISTAVIYVVATALSYPALADAIINLKPIGRGQRIDESDLSFGPAPKTISAPEIIHFKDIIADRIAPVQFAAGHVFLYKDFGLTKTDWKTGPNIVVCAKRNIAISQFIHIEDICQETWEKSGYPQDAFADPNLILNRQAVSNIPKTQMLILPDVDLGLIKAIRDRDAKILSGNDLPPAQKIHVVCAQRALKKGKTIELNDLTLKTAKTVAAAKPIERDYVLWKCKAPNFFPVGHMFTYADFKRQPETWSKDPTLLLTFTRDVKKGELIQAHHLIQKKWPGKSYPQGALSDPNIAIGRTCKNYVQKGEVVRLSSFDPGIEKY